MAETYRTDVAIIGGGLAGLACAVALSECGIRVSLFESSERLGGRAQSWIDRQTADVVDIGPHIFLSAYRNMLKLLERLGSDDRIVWQTDKLIRLREGSDVTDMFVHRLPPPLHLAPSFARVRSVSLRDKLSNTSILQLAMQLDEQGVRGLDSLTAEELLRREGVTDSFMRWFWATACLTVMNVPLEKCSAGALMRVFAQLVGRRDYCIGFAGCGLAELFVPQATGKITAAGGRLHLRSRAVHVAARDGAVDTVALEDGAQVHARFVVLAVPPHALAEMLPEELLRQAPFADLGAFEPSPYISTYLWFDRKLSNEKFWTQIADPKYLNSDYYDLSNIRPEWQSRASVIASNIIFSHRAHHLSDDEIVSRTTEEVRDALPEARDARVTHAAVHRIPMAIACPSPGLESKRPMCATPIRGLLLAGDWTQTHLPSCMESAVVAGWSAAEHVLRSLGQDQRLVEPVQAVQGLVAVAQKAKNPRH